MGFADQRKELSLSLPRSKVNVTLSLGLAWIYHPGCLVMAVSKYGSGLIVGCTELAKVHPESSDKGSNFHWVAELFLLWSVDWSFYCPRFFYVRSPFLS